ncbi:hypothetical protein GQ457_09G016490 [Hibiscus cannabinus]
MIHSMVDDKLSKSVIIRLLGWSIGYTTLLNRIRVMWNPSGEIAMRIEYEGLPVIFYECCCYGHTKDVYKFNASDLGERVSGDKNDVILANLERDPTDIQEHLDDTEGTKASSKALSIFNGVARMNLNQSSNVVVLVLESSIVNALVDVVHVAGADAKELHAAKNVVVETVDVASSKIVVPSRVSLNPKAHIVVRVLERGKDKSHGPDLVALFETRVSASKADHFIARHGFSFSFRIEANGFSIGIWILWKHPNSRKRDELWSQLEALRPSGNVALLLGGDFNVIINTFERTGGSSRRKGISVEFGEFLQRFGLNDLGFHGARFTWKQGDKYLFAL